MKWACLDQPTLKPLQTYIKFFEYYTSLIKKLRPQRIFYLKVSANCTFFINFIAEFSFHGVS